MIEWPDYKKKIEKKQINLPSFIEMWLHFFTLVLFSSIKKMRLFLQVFMQLIWIDFSEKQSIAINKIYFSLDNDSFLLFFPNY